MSRRPVRPARPPAGAAVHPSRRAGRVTFGVVNFKSIASAQLEPRRLTIIAGSNSSGKSSLLQALLFAAQSFGEPTPVINGDLVRLGEASDVIRDGMEETTLEFIYPEISRDESEAPVESARNLRLTLASREQGRSLVANEFSLWRGDTCVCKAVETEVPKSLPLAGEEQALRIFEPAQFNLPEQSYLTVAGITPSRIVYEANDNELSADFQRVLDGKDSHWPIDELFRIALSTSSDESAFDRLRELVQQGAHKEPQKLSAEDRKLLFDAYREMMAPSGWISESIAQMSKARPYLRTPAETQGRIDASYLGRDIGRGLEQVERLAAAVLYLGPLRDDPRVAYPLGHTVRTLPVGEKGEFTAAYLRENQRERVQYGGPDGVDATDLLPNAVNRWCGYLGIAEQIKVTARGKLGHELGLRVGGQDRDPTAIGVGASQLLPVIVMVLGAPQGSVILLEQPELHLHPKVQSRLADFLAYARRNVRIVVETHSEYLLTRLRLRIAENKLDRDELAVLFATQLPDSEDKSGKALHTEFDHLNIDELGDFHHWPEGFFDSLDNDSVELAQAVASRLQENRDTQKS